MAFESCCLKINQVIYRKDDKYEINKTRLQNPDIFAKQESGGDIKRGLGEVTILFTKSLFGYQEEELGTAYKTVCVRLINGEP